MTVPYATQINTTTVQIIGLAIMGSVVNAIFHKQALEENSVQCLKCQAPLSQNLVMQVGEKLV